MDHMQRWKSACYSAAFPCDDQRPPTLTASFYGIRKKSGSATLGLILFCLIMLLGSPAGGQSDTDDRLAPQDMVEVSISGWTALRGGVAEGSALSDTFTIGTNGTLDLPIIGHVPAAGLRADELAKLITDLLQARSGLQERPVTIVQRKQSAMATDSTHVERRQFAAQQQALEQKQRSKTDTLLRELSAARTELTATRREALATRREALAARQAAHDDAVRNSQGLAAERQRAAALTQQLNAARAHLEAVKAQMAQQTNAASRARQAAEALTKEQQELAARERAKAAALEQNLVAARREVDALKNSQQTAGNEREEALRSELTAAREELGAMRHAARDTSAQARAVADTTAEQGRTLEEQRQRAQGLARDLILAQREVEDLKAKTVLVDRERGAARQAAHDDALRNSQGLAAERQRAAALTEQLSAARADLEAVKAQMAQQTNAASRASQAAEALTKEQQELAERERTKAAALEQNLVAARREVDALKTAGGEREKALHSELAAALATRQAAHDDALRNSRGLAVERQRAAALTEQLSAARADLEAVKAGMAQQTNAASRARQAAEALAKEQQELAERERTKAAALEQNLVAARREVDALKNSQQTAGNEREEALRSELTAAREELGAMRHAARDTSAQARAVADTTAEQGRTLEEQRQRAQGLARDLILAQREVEDLKAKTVLVDREMGAARAAHLAAEASLTDARQALDEERHRVERFERDITAARQSIDALEASANLAAAAQATALQGQQVAEAAAKRVGEQLALERERADLVARDLEAARQERDAAKEEVTRVLAALEQERNRALGLARDLAAARTEIDVLKARIGRRIARIENGPKARATDRTIRRSSPPVRAAARSARESGLPQIRKEIRKPTRAVRLSTIVLPDALLPTRPPVRGVWQ